MTPEAEERLLRQGAVLLPAAGSPEAEALSDRLALNVQKRGYLFECPLCRNRMRNDALNMPPLCTGPHPSLNEHEPELMRLVPGQVRPHAPR